MHHGPAPWQPLCLPPSAAALNLAQEEEKKRAGMRGVVGDSTSPAPTNGKNTGTLRLSLLDGGEAAEECQPSSLTARYTLCQKAGSKLPGREASVLEGAG